MYEQHTTTHMCLAGARTIRYDNLSWICERDAAKLVTVAFYA
jgi:hypothetical protein